MTPRSRGRDLALLALAAVTGLFALTAYATVRIWQEGARDDRRPVGAIVVLGAAQFDGVPSPVFAARLDHAVDLFRQGIAPYLVVTGGKAVGDHTTEAASARTYAEARGVPAAAILMEDTGRTTLQSLRAIVPVLRSHGIRDAVFVSDPTHMLRVIRIATDLGIDAHGSPTPTSRIEADPALKLDATAHELAAFAWYLLAGDTSGDDPAATR